MRTIKTTFLLLAVATTAFATSVVGSNTTVSFQPGASALSTESKIQLQNFVKRAKEVGRIDEVKVAAWSDNPAPKEGEELSKQDKELAAQRAASIQEYLKDLKVKAGDTYNMAERASWVSRLFHTDSAKLKEELNKDGTTKDEFQIIKNNGEPSKVVVLALLKR